MFYSKIVELSWLNNTGGIKITLNYVWISVKTVICSNIRNQIWGAGSSSRRGGLVQVLATGPSPRIAAKCEFYWLEFIVFSNCDIDVY